MDGSTMDDIFTLVEKNLLIVGHPMQPQFFYFSGGSQSILPKVYVSPWEWTLTQERNWTLCPTWCPMCDNCSDPDKEGKL